MEDGNVAVLVDAKEEYTKQLVSILKPCIYQGIKSIYMDAKDICHQDNTPDNILMVFQDLLSRIPKWSQDIIIKEYDRISSVSKCDYIDDLLKVVYVSHIKVLTIVHSAQKNKKISIKVPSGSHFIHLCYIECAREFWKDPYLFSDRVSKYEHQKNMRDSENMISECISETIRKQLPVRHILKEFLNEPDEEIEEEEEDIKDPINKKYLKKLETVVKKELKTTNKGIELDMDLIRKVIREEMDSRSISNNVSETSIIKKELVDTVVEKIVEQSEQPVQSNETSVILESIPINETIVALEDSVVKSSLTDSKLIETIQSVEPSTIETNTTIETKKENTPETNTVIESNQTESNQTESNQSVNNNIINNNEINGESLNNILDDLENNEIDIKSNNIKDNNIKDNNKIEDKNADKNNDNNTIIKESSSDRLVINNIDEINLNLDELDSELGGELDLDNLQSINLKESPNEIKKDPNTKYIFYKDT